MKKKRRHSDFLRVVSARVDGHTLVLRLSDGTEVERDFYFVRGPALDHIHRRDRLDPRVRITEHSVEWPRETDFGLDTILWGTPDQRRGRRRPMRRALVGSCGSLVPSPLARDL